MNKYGNKKVKFAGNLYASKLEAEVSLELADLYERGLISGFDRQKKFPLKVNGKLIKTYTIDFEVWYFDCSTNYLEVKGFETRDWKLTWKLLEAVFDQDFRKHPNDKLSVYKQGNKLTDVLGIEIDNNAAKETPPRKPRKTPTQGFSPKKDI